MNLCSLEFLLLLLVASAVFPWIANIRLRQSLLAMCNAGLLYSFVPGLSDGLCLGLFVASGYVIASLLQVHPHRWILGLYVTLLISAFLVLKKYEFLAVLLPAPVLSHTIGIVGLSYMLFRQIHVAVDALQGQIKDLSLWTYLNYQLNLFGLLAGPIQRYQDFAEDWNRLQPLAADSYDLLRAYLRIFLGVIKMVVVSNFCLESYESLSAVFVDDAYRSTGKNVVKFFMLLYLYPTYLYFNFSGYCDIAIGGAFLFGLRMPENFHAPFISRNMIEFWSRWHMTLGMWIRDYVFTPLYKTIAGHWPDRASSLAFLCYFVALFLAGVWHGATWNFVIFGLLNGVGVSAAKLWETLLLRRRGRRGVNAYLESRAIRALAVA